MEHRLPPLSQAPRRGLMEAPPPPRSRYAPPSRSYSERNFGYNPHHEQQPRHHYDGPAARSYNHQHRHHPLDEPDARSRPAFPPPLATDYYLQGAERRRSLNSPAPHHRKKEEVVERQALVDHVHHDSACGPATSVYPKRHFAPPSPSEERRRREELWRAEEAKLARVRNEQRDHGFGSEERFLQPRHHHDKEDPAQRRNAPPQIEISPGVTVPLRGSAETRAYVQCDRIVPAVCLACDTHLFGIQDAKYLLCPTCRVVNPIEAEDRDTGDSHHYDGSKPPPPPHGVGLGITLDMLYTLQQEILQQEQREQHHRLRGGSSYW